VPKHSDSADGAYRAPYAAYRRPPGHGRDDLDVVRAGGEVDEVSMLSLAESQMHRSSMHEPSLGSRHADASSVHSIAAHPHGLPQSGKLHPTPSPTPALRPSLTLLPGHSPEPALRAVAQLAAEEAGRRGLGPGAALIAVREALRAVAQEDGGPTVKRAGIEAPTMRAVAFMAGLSSAVPSLGAGPPPTDVLVGI